MSASKPPKEVNTTLALAQYLGLSRWTVSRALNGHPGVKAETVERVNEAMNALGFSPNALARGLRGGKTGVVGICFQTFGTPVFSKKVKALQKTLLERGYRAIIELIEDDAEAERQVVRHFQSLQVEGIIFVGGPHAENVSLVEELNRNSPLSIVAMDPFDEVALPRVRLDREWAMRESLEKLFALGHRRIALFGIREGIIYGAERVRALKDAAQGLGLVWGDDIVEFSDPSNAGMDYEGGRVLAENFLKDGSARTAIIAINDQVAIGAKGMLQESGKTIPGDISIVGFDNLDVAAHLHPTLASVDQRIGHTATQAVELLLEGMDSNGKRPDTRLAIEPHWVDGESIGPASRKGN